MQEVAPPRLTRAALRLTEAPPSMERAVEMLTGARDRRWFDALALELLPEESEKILAGEGAAEVITRFADAFSERYFPLHEAITWDLAEDDGESAYSRLSAGIPLEPTGIDEEEWHDVWESCGRGMGAIALLQEVPHDTGVRTAWLEEAARHIPLSTLQRIPQGGIPIDRIEKALLGTRLECVSGALRWFFQDSDNLFVDISPDMYYESAPVPWDMETITRLAEEWQLARPILETSRQAQRTMDGRGPAGPVCRTPGPGVGADGTGGRRRPWALPRRSFWRSGKPTRTTPPASENRNAR